MYELLMYPELNFFLSNLRRFFTLGTQIGWFIYAQISVNESKFLTGHFNKQAINGFFDKSNFGSFKDKQCFKNNYIKKILTIFLH